MADLTRRSDLLLAAAGLAGLAAFLLLYERALPQAAVDLTVDRGAAATIAQEFLGAREAPLAELKHASQFGGSSVALVFLQRTLGLDEASRWAREEVPIWSWSLRWFQPEEKEEWQVDVGVDGAVTEFTHLVEEAAAGADLEQESARVLAEAFAGTRGWTLDRLELVESSSRKRDNRTDHHFEWERQGGTITWREGDPEAGTGAVRVAVDVQGDAIGGYRHYLKVPEQFRRDLVQSQSVGQLLALGSLALTFVLVLVALGIAIARHRRDDIRWRPALILAGVMAVLFLAGGATSWPSVLYGYPTNYAWVAYVGVVVFGLFFVALLYAIWALFTASAGESLGRETFPASLAGFLDAARGRLLTTSMAAAGLRGYALAFLFLGYLTVFYVLARTYLGAWMPAEGPYSEIFNNYLPFLAPLTVSVVAAVTEELTYRLFGISLFKRYFKSTVLALLIPAMIWAFAHSNYPVFPVYVRGVELTIGGLIFGVAFLRLGLLTCIVAHYVVDAVVIGAPLLTSGNATYVASGVVVMGLALVPAGLGVVARWRMRGPAESSP